MMKTINEALDFYSGQEKKFSSFRASILKKRTVPVEELNQVASDLSLPKCYADFVNRYSVEGVSTGLL